LTYILLYYSWLDLQSRLFSQFSLYQMCANVCVLVSYPEQCSKNVYPKRHYL